MNLPCSIRARHDDVDAQIARPSALPKGASPMSRLTQLAVASLLSMSIFCTTASHAQPTTDAVDVGATVPAEGDVIPLEATITGVEGLVQVRGDEAQPWQKAVIGMVV